MKMTVSCSHKPTARLMFIACLCNRLDIRMLQVLRKVEASFMLETWVDDRSLLSVTVVHPVHLKTHTGKWWISFTANMLLFATDLYGCFSNNDVVTWLQPPEILLHHIDVLWILISSCVTFSIFFIMVADMSVHVCALIWLCNWRHSWKHLISSHICMKQ